MKRFIDHNELGPKLREYLHLIVEGILTDSDHEKSIELHSDLSELERGVASVVASALNGYTITLDKTLKECLSEGKWYPQQDQMSSKHHF